MSVEQRHRDAARKWLVKRERTSEYTIDSLARLLADTERAALDRLTERVRNLWAIHGGHERFIDALDALAAAPTTEDRTP